MPNDILKERLSYFTQEYYDFLMSDFVEVSGAEAQQIFGLDVDTRTAFENMLCLNTMLFLNRIEFTEAVIIECGLDIEDSIKLVQSTLSKLPSELLIAQQVAVLTLAENFAGILPEKDRFNYIQTLPQQKFVTYLYVKTSQKINNLCLKYQSFNEESINLCRMLIGDILLKVYRIEDTVALFQQELNLDAKTAALLGADIIDFLTPLFDSNWQPPVEERGDYLKHEYIPNEVDTSVSPLIPQLRTMASDMQEERSPARATFNAAVALDDEPIYSSTQPIIQRTAPDAPSYTAPMYKQPKPNVDAPLEKPRWG
jgi:hypothetical protein